jgi:hypothetical protein
MRTLLAALLLLALSPFGHACNCFPPEVRAKTAQEALEKAQLAVFGRVLEVDANGNAKVLVLESFKGPAVGSTIEAVQDVEQCGVIKIAVDEQAFVLAFKETVTACDKHPPEHYMLEEFRKNAAQAK